MNVARARALGRKYDTISSRIYGRPWASWALHTQCLNLQHAVKKKTRNHEHGANAKALGRKFDAILTHAVAQLATSNSRISTSAQNLKLVWLPSGVLRGICGCWSAFRLRNSTCPKSVDLALRTRKSMDPGTWHNRTVQSPYEAGDQASCNNNNPNILLLITSDH